MLDINRADNDQLDRIAILKDAQWPFKLYRDFEATSSKEWLVKNLFGRGEQSAAYGAPGSGKSALGEDMGLHVAGGLPWLGRDVTQGGVLYIALERRLLVERRAIAFRQHRGIENLPFAVMGGVFDFRDPRTAVKVADAVKQFEDATAQKTALIIIDTVNRALNGGDENSSKDMGAIVATSTRLQDATAAHIQWIHHVPVDGGERLRGHGALLGALDTTLYIEKISNNLRTATVIKANDSEEGQQISFRLESVTIGEETTAPVVVATETKIPASNPNGPRLTKNQQTMFSVLHDAGPAGLTTEAWNEKMRDAGIGGKRKADLVDIRGALKSKNLIREYAGVWRTVD